jgi:hypothetical protein
MEIQMRVSTILVCASMFTFLIACGDDGRSGDTGAGDTGAGDTGRIDSSRPDTGTPDTSMDTGPADPCATDEATETVECNGDILGPTQEDDALFGSCTPEKDSDQGSCEDATAICYAVDADLEDTTRGVCVPACTPNGTNYVSTSTCPSGSRCFNFGDGSGFCFADCNAPADCVSGQCDGDNSCVGGEPSTTDGGTDGGTDSGTDGGTDGGTDAASDAATDAAADAADA